MFILSFLKVYWLDITIVISIISLIVFLYLRGHEDMARKIILNLVTEAELHLGSGTGELKYAYVIDKVYKKLPWIITLFLTEKKLNVLIENGVYILNDYLDDGKLNKTFE